jgi:hypothetical protein
MALAARAAVRASRVPRWIVLLLWSLRGAGLASCTAAMLLTPEFVRVGLRGGQPLLSDGLDSLFVYRVLAALAGGVLLVLAERLPGFSHRPDSLLRVASIGLPITIVGVCALLKTALGPENRVYTGLAAEDAVIEYATSAAYLAAGCTAVPVARRLRRRGEALLAGLWAAFAVTLVFASGEEISWGQRLLGLATPAAFSSNVQGEMTVHNLPPVQHVLHYAYIAVGLYGALGWSLLLERGGARLRGFTRWVVPPPMLLGCFLPVALVYAAFQFTPPAWIGPHGLRFGFVSTYDQEPAELLLSLGFLLFAAGRLASLRRW